MSSVSSNWHYYFRCVARHTQITQYNKFAITLQYQKVSDNFIFCMQISVKACYKLMQRFWWGWSSILKIAEIESLQCLYDILKNMLKMKLTFCIQINIKVSSEFISTLWVSKFPTKWHYLYWWAWSSILKVLKVTSFQYLFNISFFGYRYTSKFMQVDIIIFNESGQTYPKYPK